MTTNKSVTKRAPRKTTTKAKSQPTTKGFDLFGLEEDESKSVDGVWEDFIEDGKVVGRIKVARANNSAYAKVLAQGYESNREIFDAGNSPKATQAEKLAADSVAEKVEQECFGKGILKDWSGFIGQDGKPLPYTWELGAMAYRKIPSLRVQVLTIANDAEVFRIRSLVSDAEQLKK